MARVGESERDAMFQQTHYGKLYSWLCQKRLPMFTKSHLFFHYRLCKELCIENPILESFNLLEKQCEF